MIREIVVKCPNCAQDDATNVELDENLDTTFVTVQCEGCTIPYTMAVKLSLETRVFRIVEVV